ncbi:MAG TPA: amino acid adenylation domain-containing protein [Epulopiscium sp.]|nr:amino acid adenylation domain-containing protein [Candidatus Epulonipiscium sp.]
MRSVRDTFIVQSYTKKEIKQYWLEKFKGQLKYTSLLNTDTRKCILNDYQKFTFKIHKNIDKNLNLENFFDNNIKTYALLLATLKCLIYKYTLNNDVIVLSPIIRKESYKNSYSKSVFIRDSITNDLSLEDVLHNVLQSINEAYLNQDYKFEELFEHLMFPNGNFNTCLTDIACVLNNIHSNQEYINMHCNIIFVFDSFNEFIKGTILYNPNIFSRQMISQIHKHFISIFKSYLLNVKIKIRDLNFTNEEDMKNIIQFNNTNKKYDNNKAIYEIFEDQVKENPYNIAIKYNDIQINYKELNSKVNKLARFLIKKGVNIGDYIALISERSIDMIVGAMAILKAGGAYVPISKNLPKTRIDYILRDSNVSIILMQSNLLKDDYSDYEVILLDKDNFDDENDKDIGKISGPHDLAYILYTSGTTGNPKGVLIEHRSVVNLSQWFGKTYNLDKNKNVLHMTNISFDVSVEETITTLLNGATIVILPENMILNQNTFKEFIDKYDINIAQFVPITLKELLLKNKKMNSLKVVICGGDKLDSKLRDEVLDLGYTLYNNYGPTEATVDSIFTRCRKGKNVIGKPINNTQILICDEFNVIQPIGVAGELCIMGDGVARGYLNNKELTMKKFVSSPLNTNKKMYKTGDFARWLPDGNIEFIGRIDDQVKINGVRIELGEIESKILCHKDIENAAVIAKPYQNGNLCIYAYFTSKRVLSSKELKEHLTKYLPDYMIPKYFIHISKFPLMPSGKIDKNKLSENNIYIKHETKYIPPSNYIEKKLVEIWKDELGLDKIGINENFFDLGGDSLKAAIIAHRIHKEVSNSISLSDIFENFTIEHIARNISHKEQKILFNKEESDENLVFLKKNVNSNLNCFIVHAGNGEVEIYTELCKYLKQDFNYWGIRANRLNCYAPINIRIETIAKYYIDKIKMIQPKGPYYILGWCIGGSIAFEMALQLEKMNEEVKFLGLINSFAPDREFWGEISPFTVESEIEEATRYFNEQSFRNELLKQKDIEHIWKYTINYFKKLNISPETIKQFVVDDMDKAIPNYNGKISVQEIIYYINILRTFDNARALYIPSRKVNTQVHFFAANQEKTSNIKVWNKYCTIPIKVYEIIGNNFSIFSKPNVLWFANKFNNIDISII